MAASRSIAILLGILAACCGCADWHHAPASGKNKWPLTHVRTQPADEITVVSGTTFRCCGIPCQLLGVKESDDPAVRKQAEIFTKAWFTSIGNCIGFYNESNPLMTKDGTAVVWVRGYDTYLSCLSEELVRAGLVEIDESQWQTMPSPSRPRKARKRRSGKQCFGRHGKGMRKGKTTGAV